MKLKGWLIVGGAAAGHNVTKGLFVAGALPNAALATVGDWITWKGAPDAALVTLVCVEIPL